MSKFVSAITNSFQNPSEVEAKVFGLDKWLKFSVETSYTDENGNYHYALQQAQILIEDPLVLFRLRHEVEILIKHYMEE